eukprot:4763910-Pleurochrysis_carterae.AAC.2
MPALACPVCVQSPTGATGCARLTRLGSRRAATKSSRQRRPRAAAAHNCWWTLRDRLRRRRLRSPSKTCGLGTGYNQLRDGEKTRTLDKCEMEKKHVYIWICDLRSLRSYPVD